MAGPTFWDRAGILVLCKKLEAPRNLVIIVPSGYDTLKARKNSPGKRYHTEAFICCFATELGFFEQYIHEVVRIAREVLRGLMHKRGTVELPAWLRHQLLQPGQNTLFAAHIDPLRKSCCGSSLRRLDAHLSALSDTDPRGKIPRCRLWH